MPCASLVSPLLTNQSNTTPSLPPKLNASSLSIGPGRRKGPYTFPITGTQTVLIINAYPSTTSIQCPSSPSSAKPRAPDTPLTNLDNPFMYKYTSRPGLRGGSCHIIAQSWYDKQQGLQQQLTYGTLRDVLWGSRELVHDEEMYMGLSFDVGDEIFGSLGRGYFGRGCYRS